MSRLAIVQEKRCFPQKCGEACLKHCPVNRAGEPCISLTSNTKALVQEGLCNGCGICVNVCPFEAIHILRLPEELDITPIHRYGQNGFALYSLPTPLSDKVVGVIGRNGIGKSTAIKILSQHLPPNLGMWDKEGAVPVEEIINYFKGTEAQTFFERVRDGVVRVSYKPQAVDRIPQQVEGSVRELLEKISSGKEIDSIADALDLRKILDHDVKHLSGGELQRLAIAAASFKESELYIFDEPTSYLDIKQRIRTSRFIRKMVSGEKGVLVVEHDLIVLDYLTDVVHIMYGQPAGFGVVSLPRSTRVGINAYLDGFLREENMRFRPQQIKFTGGRANSRTVTQSPLLSWKGIRKQLGEFSIQAEEGAIPTSSVVGVLGENATGKTTFVKILAGEIEADKGELSATVKVAYKPQYLHGEDERTVGEVLVDAFAQHSTTLIGPLEIEKLKDQRIKDLSGGELQRVSVCLCLAKDADLYLLDEPSAYLDVEQRLAISKVIKDMMVLRETSALVVDHDLLFIDQISDNLIIFSGEPAVEGLVSNSMEMEEGMNLFLESLDITMRRDEQSNRPRINKTESRKDREQKNSGKRYYS